MILHSATRLLGAAFLTLGLGTPAATLAQQVIFPQERQAGTARLAHSANHYTLSNDLLTATFIESEGTLRFGGCPQLNLNAGSELFEIRMGNGSTVVRASEMKLSNVREIHYAANPSPPRGLKNFLDTPLKRHSPTIISQCFGAPCSAMAVTICALN